MTLFRSFTIIILLLVVSFAFITPIYSNSDEELDKKKQEIEQIKQELDKIQGQKQTLSSTIRYLDNKIRLTQIQISQTQTELEQTQTEINDLSDKIYNLDISLSDLTEQLIHRVNQSYKESRLNPFLTLITSNQLNQIVSKIKYLQQAEKHNRDIIFQMESARTDFDQQKLQKEIKERELNALTAKLESQKLDLNKQQLDKKSLLDITNNDERRFQSELAKKMAELEAIQSIIAGKGQETQVGDVKEGAVIASVIPGSSACSTGAHLHFEVAQNGQHLNPASYLSSKTVIWSNDPDGPFDFSGSWRWPLSDPIRITQGYGMTFFASVIRFYGGNPHTGIDMINTDLQVKAVKPGLLYRGAIACGGGTLRYVRVDHQDSDYDTYYLHINY